MSNEEQELELARLAGWSHITNSCGTFWWREEDNKNLPQGDDGFRKKPDLLNDLNEIHRAEMSLNTLGLWLVYRFHLSCIVSGAAYDKGGYVQSYKKDDSTKNWIDCVRANPAQRREAILRTVGKISQPVNINNKTNEANHPSQNKSGCPHCRGYP